MAKKTLFFFFFPFLLPIHHVLLLTPVCLQSYFGTHSLLDHILSVSKFATSSSVPPKSSFVFFWLSLIYAFSHSSTCYTLLFTITSIKPLPSTPWWDLFPALSFWAYDFSTRSSTSSISFHFIMFEKLLVLHTSHPPTLLAFMFLLPWHPHSPHPARNTWYEHFFSLTLSTSFYDTPPCYGAL